jgi:hypothetical protein
MSTARYTKLLILCISGLLPVASLASPKAEDFRPFLDKFCTSAASRASVDPNPRAKQVAGSQAGDGGVFFLSRVRYPVRYLSSAPTEPDTERASEASLPRQQFAELNLEGCGCDSDPTHVNVRTSGPHVEAQFTSDTECTRTMQFERVSGQWMLVELSVQD